MAVGKTKIIMNTAILQDLQKQNKKINELVAKVGILKGDAEKPKQNEDGPDGPLSLVEIATVHEFGSSDGRVPERSFLRGYIAEKSTELRQAFIETAKLVVAGKETAEDGLSKIATATVGGIQARISAGIKPDLKESTIERKAKSTKAGLAKDTPLILTSQLRQSITYALDKKAAKGKLAGGKSKADTLKDKGRVN